MNVAVSPAQLDLPARRQPGGLGDVALALPGLLAIGMGVVLAVFDGGFPATVWYPAALFTLALLVVSMVAAPPRLPASRLVRAALLAYGLFAAWSFVGIAWADAPGDAWDAANRTLLYGLVLTIAATTAWTRTTATLALGMVAFGAAAIAIAILVVGALGDDPSGLFLGGRIAEPAGYLNATANLWAIGLFPALHLASGGHRHWALRAGGLSAAAVLLQMQLLSQSRGAAIALAVVGIAYLGLTPRRWPTLLALAGAAALTALSFDTLTGVRDAAGVAELGQRIEGATTAVVLSACGAFALGAVAALASTGLRPVVSRRREALRVLRRGGDGLLVALAVAALAAGVAAIGSPADWVEARWDDFKNSGYTRADSGATRFTGGLGSNRYDFYRVALEQFERQPVRGVGGDNFAADYIRERRTLEAPRHPHSLALRVLSQHGVVGGALFVAFALMLVAAAVMARIGASRAGAGASAAALAGFLAFAVHAMGDWLWSFPALAVLAFGLLGVAVSGEGDAVVSGRRWTPGIAARLALGFVALAVAASFAVPGIAARYTSAAYDGFRDDPARALERLDRAADLNPLADGPLVAKGVIEQRLGRPGAAIRPLEEAISRNERNWFAHLELALAHAQLGNMRPAVAGLRRARRLNPLQPVIRSSLRRLRRGRPLDPIAVERQLFEGLRERLRAVDPK